jgi:glutamate synthase (NADPH/NADH) small chain
MTAENKKESIKDTRPTKVPMPEQAPEVRRRNFLEVPHGYTAEMAMEEARRCLQCKKPACVGGCPVNINIPEFINFIAQGEFEKAILSIKTQNSLPAVCGRVCPQESQCEAQCILGKKLEPVGIGRLERFAADWGREHNVAPAKPAAPNGRRVAVIGAGPAGLTCAGDLIRLGYSVTLFEALHNPGGVLVYGIPEFRLPKDIVYKEVDMLKAQGLDLQLNMVVGKVYDLQEVMDLGYEAVFIGTGAGLPLFMGIPGEELNGVYSANEYLTRINLMKAYKFPEWDTPVHVGKRVAVIGGGNVAMDAARCSLRLPGVEEVHIIYRRSGEEMPARIEESHHAKEEGVIFDVLTNPLQYIGDENGWVKKAELQKQELGEPDASGRRRPVPVEGSNYTIEVDTVVVAIGQKPSPLVPLTAPALNTRPNRTIETDEETCATSIPGVYAGGDVATGAATVISAMGAGKRAAESIHKYLSAKA